LNEEYSQKERQINQEMDSARQKAEQILAQAKADAERSKNQIIKEAKEQRDKILRQARLQSDELIQQADKSRQLLISELEQRIEKEAVIKASELIQSSLPEQFKQSAHAYWIEDLIKNGFSELKHLAIPEGINEVKVISAFPLTEQQRASLSKGLRQLLNRDITLKEELDPKVVVGIIVNIGSLVLDGSLKNKIRQQTSGINAR
jgi:F0F1-type ATP synthase delta subunit